MSLAEKMICGEPLGHRVVAVVPKDNYALLLTFSNGERRIFDARPLLEIPVFKALNRKPFFESVKVEYGTIAWAQDIDYCPDTLYIESTPYIGE